MKRLILVLGIVSGVWACDRGSSSPSTPSPVRPSAPQPAVLPISGYVYDTAFRPVAGASVQLVDGPQSGRMKLVGPGGFFFYEGTFSMPVPRGATKDGYATATVPARALTDGRAYA